jgi:hypothetical protein
MITLDDADQISSVRSIDFILSRLRAAYELKRSYRLADLRGDMTGSLADTAHATKLRLAKHHLDAIRARKEKERLGKLPENVSLFHQRQAY